MIKIMIIIIILIIIIISIANKQIYSTALPQYYPGSSQAATKALKGINSQCTPGWRDNCGQNALSQGIRIK